MDRLQAGEMSLWEYQAAVHGWNSRQPKSGPDTGPTATEEQWEELRVATRRTVEQADERRNGG